VQETKRFLRVQSVLFLLTGQVNKKEQFVVHDKLPSGFSIKRRTVKATGASS